MPLLLILFLISINLAYADKCETNIKLIDPKNIDIINDSIRRVNIDDLVSKENDLIAQRNITQDQINEVHAQLQSYKAIGAIVPGNSN